MLLFTFFVIHVNICVFEYVNTFALHFTVNRHF